MTIDNKQKIIDSGGYDMASKLFVLALALASLPEGVVYGQAVANVSSIAPDSPDLFFGFFHLQAAINQASKTDPSIARSAAHMMGITDVEFASLTTVAEAVVADLSDIRAQETAARNTASVSDRSEITKRFASRHRASLLNAVTVLRHNLSPQSWIALRNYVNGPYRNSIHIRTVASR